VLALKAQLLAEASYYKRTELWVLLAPGGAPGSTLCPTVDRFHPARCVLSLRRLLRARRVSVCFALAMAVQLHRPVLFDGLIRSSPRKSQPSRQRDIADKRCGGQHPKGDASVWFELEQHDQESQSSRCRARSAPRCPKDHCPQRPWWRPDHRSSRPRAWQRRVQRYPGNDTAVSDASAHGTAGRIERDQARARPATASGTTLPRNRHVPRSWPMASARLRFKPPRSRC
jgi:hypothetical protein